MSTIPIRNTACMGHAEKTEPDQQPAAEKTEATDHRERGAREEDALGADHEVRYSVRQAHVRTSSGYALAWGDTA